ncbi:hypothetical protein [Methylobacterium sp. D54C]
MSGLLRLLFAGGGCALRRVAGLPIGAGAVLIRAAALCERRAAPRRDDGPSRAPPG